MKSVFSKIISGEIPSYKIHENDNFYAFLDINPLAEGHTLVVTKIEVDYIFDINDPLYIELMLFAKKIAKAIKDAIPCNRVGMAVIGLEVPHCHIHLCPINDGNDLNFSNPKLKFTDDEFTETKAKIKKYLV